jgi:hypothetical protein
MPTQVGAIGNKVDPQLIQPALGVELDWDAYYLKFKEVHGDPVLFKGRLLFGDGWTYSSSDTSGPEYPPNKDSKQRIKDQLVYWGIRKHKVKVELQLLQNVVAELKELQVTHSIPLQQKRITFDEDKKQHIIDATDVDVQSIELGRLFWLEQDLLLSQEKILELKIEYAELAGECLVEERSVAR